MMNRSQAPQRPEVTDEMVEAGAKVEWEFSAQHKWADLHEMHRRYFRRAMRAALTAALDESES
jgi:hypothetical protein